MNYESKLAQALSEDRLVEGLKKLSYDELAALVKTSSNRFEREVTDKLPFGGKLKQLAREGKREKMKMTEPLTAIEHSADWAKNKTPVGVNHGPMTPYTRSRQVADVKGQLRTHISQMRSAKKTGLGQPRSLVSRLGGALKKLSFDELASLVKEGCDEPASPKAKKMKKASVTKLAKTETTRDRARRWGRTGAAIGGSLAAAGHLGSGLPFGVGGAAISTAANAGLGYGIGRLAHRIGHGPSSETEKVKKSSAANIALVSGWGRELARTDLARAADALEKTAIPAWMGSALNKVGPTIGKAMGVVGRAAPHAMGVNAAIGAGAGMAMGGARHLMRSPEERRQHSLVGSMVGHGLVGAGLGAASGPFARKAMQAPVVQRMVGQQL